MLRAVETTVRTDVGRQRRGNEDSCYAQPPMFVLADGMGGARAGEVASQMAIEAFEQGLPAEGSPEERLALVVRRANHEIHERSRAEAEYAGMGTTVTAAYVQDDALALAHVGDSRAYLLRDGELSRLTEDHSLVEELVRGGKLTPEQAFEHPQRSVITRALGVEPIVEVDTWTYPLRPGDVVLLCSDGLTDMLQEEQVRLALAESGNLNAAAERLIAEANAAGGRDNITVVMFRVGDSERGSEGALDQPTQALSAAELAAAAAADDEAPGAGGHPGAGARTPAAAPVAAAPAPVRRAPLARLQGLRPRMPAGFVQQAEQPRHSSRRAKLLAALSATLVVLFLIGAGGYIASRQLYFLGTNGKGTVVIFRGFPYVLPFGIPMYETFYVSGVPASTIPAARRATLLNHAMRDQGDAISLVNDLERGKITG